MTNHGRIPISVGDESVQARRGLGVFPGETKTLRTGGPLYGVAHLYDEDVLPLSSPAHLCHVRGVVFVSGPGGTIYRLDAASWTPIMPDSRETGSVGALLSAGDRLFVYIHPGHFFFSDDYGQSWMKRTSPVGYNFLVHEAGAWRDVLYLIVRDTTANVIKVIYSTDRGASWQNAEAGLAGETVMCHAANDSYIVFGTSAGKAVSMTIADGSFDQADIGTQIDTITAYGMGGADKWFLTTGALMYEGAVDADAWTLLTHKMPGRGIFLTHQGEARLLGLFQTGGRQSLHASSDEGKNWVAVTEGVVRSATALALHGDGLIVTDSTHLFMINTLETTITVTEDE